MISMLCFNNQNLQFYTVQVGLQSPEGITSTRGISRRFNEFLELFYEVTVIISCFLNLLEFLIMYYSY